MPGENNGYSQGLFNAQGPRDFADAIKGIGTNLTSVTGDFTAFGSAAEDALKKIETRLGSLSDQANNLQSALGGGGQARGGGDGGAGTGWQPDTSERGGGTGGRRGNQTGVG